MNTFVNYTPNEILNILQINQSISALLDEEVENYVIEKNDSIFNWRVNNNLVGWAELHEVYNKVFDIALSKDSWLKAVLPEKEKTIWTLCHFIAKNVKKEVVKPIKILGKECLSASIFFSLKRDLLRWGLDARDIRPSSCIAQFSDRHSFPKLAVEVSKRGISLSDTLQLKYNENLSYLQKANIFNHDRQYIDTGSIKTFRDLTIRILEAQARSE